MEHVLKACSTYNNSHDEHIFLSFFITDDKCTDGTPDALKKVLQNERLTIISADGSAYWAGGMRLAWKKALEQEETYDFYLLLNDDTMMNEDCFSMLIDTNQYSLSHFNKEGVYAAFVHDPNDKDIITYGAKKYRKGVFSSAVDMVPNGCPQRCTLTNANILLVSKYVCERIGILSDEYIHGAADWDYGIRASNAGFPVLTTSYACGTCKKDHDNAEEEANKVIPMNVKDRKKIIDKPTRQYKDSLTFFKKYNKVKYVMLCLAYYMNIYTPRVFYKLFKFRGH